MILRKYLEENGVIILVTCLKLNVQLGLIWIEVLVVFSSRSIHDFKYDNCEPWQQIVWDQSVKIVKLVDPSFFMNERFCIQVSIIWYHDIFIYLSVY